MIAIHQQRARRLRPDRDIEGQQIDLGIPEHMAEIRISGEAARANRDAFVLRVRGARKMVNGEAGRLLHLIVTLDDDVARVPTLLPCGLVCCQHPAPAKRASARQRIGGNRSRVLRRTVRTRHSDETVEFEHLSGNRTPAPDPAQRERPLRDERTAIGSQRDAARHRDSFAGALRAPGTDIAVQL